ncbi:hypothetical protein K491DRAFT_636560 [Lophiostoma macrostomum CBS 122681]|uniref:Mitochondrial import inner membrane translocase subunit TIM54 n=1 Tax=Lophiostoma macrostomum CBS 122681 TaxID=1314788 RepID=A0A6A6T029_9PLEO|nr:hypothetical protein K491DRAFT_636560 [Lophiostoma macrostomum CBS 122681]
MADPGPIEAGPTGPSKPSKPLKPPKPPNPAFRMMGLPNIRLKLPSRNWMIFLSITGSWTAAVMYDRREKRRIQRKWAKVVDHIAVEPLDAQQLPRKLTVYLSAPPGDGLVPARDHFSEFVKPILVAAAVDWDAVEGRREGDVRAGLAERIRRLRMKNGEQSREPLEVDEAMVRDDVRSRNGIREWDGIPGDIVIGRHTWKEYVRGLHEGWLGPMDPPPPPPIDELIIPAVAAVPAPSDSSPPSTSPTDDASSSAVPEPEQLKDEKPKEEEKPKKKTQPPAFNTTFDYSTSNVSPNCPTALGPTAVVPQPHLLGFLNFPIRIYRFLNRRSVAEDVGRQTAAAVLAAYQPFDTTGGPDSSTASDESQWEQQRLLQHEEAEWHKSVRERKDDDTRERIWLDDMVLDPRIAERMRKFVLTADDEERAKRLTSEKDESWLASLWPKSEQKKKAWEGLSDDLD